MNEKIVKWGKLGAVIMAAPILAWTTVDDPTAHAKTQGTSTEATMEKSHAEATIEATIPPMDLAAPATVETASFGLG